ncbi:HTH-type transcriptional regulator TtgR [Streptomonospora litoralis]|uniref:HTH-type transcriptional regulator TtgR n=1 Tax=Streptomonospora litoralis TaxID=2498135 RepID=A0A4P6Q4G3_9ACTN|nr:HTH-type transcriptional regulator TtgR [Streptomonospora litoralis]
MAERRARDEQVSATREQIISAAERLFAERGVVTVSNRQISQAAGQGNNTAVSYHFGGKAELVRAIVRRHAEPIEQARVRRLADLSGSAEVRDWVGCLVRPITEHLAELGVPSWYARFGAQVHTDPGLRDIMAAEFLTTASLREVLEGLNRCVPGMPLAVHVERSEMAGQLIIHHCAERERRLARGATTARSSWHETATGLVDAITGMWSAPVTSPDGGAPAGHGVLASRRPPGEPRSGPEMSMPTRPPRAPGTAARDHTADQPLSTGRTAPLMLLAASEARKTIAEASSAGSATRPMLPA